VSSEWNTQGHCLEGVIKIDGWPSLCLQNVDDGVNDILDGINLPSTKDIEQAHGLDKIHVDEIVPEH